MKFEFTVRFGRQYKKLPKELRERVGEQLSRLAEDPTHPSLRVKRIQRSLGIWEASVTDSIRFTFSVGDRTYVLRNLGDHDHVFHNP